MQTPIYLDYNATTPLLPEVIEVMHHAMINLFGNPSSDHYYGNLAKEAVVTSRENLAKLINAKAEEIVFTGCATEADNLAVLGLARAAAEGKNHLITTCIEHPAIQAPCKALEKQGWEVSWLGVDSTGKINPDEFRQAIKNKTAFASVMHSNNETGTIQPITEIAKMARSAGFPLHVDAAQSVGKIPVDVNQLDVDLLTIAGHKFYAPKGIGALYIREGLTLEPLSYGANHEKYFRPGTENVIHIAGIGEAARLAFDTASVAKALKDKRDLLHELLLVGIPDLKLNGHKVERLPNTLNVSFPKVDAKVMLESINDKVAASVGSACHSGDEAVSGVLAAMGVSYDQAKGSVRLSVGRPTSNSDIEFAGITMIDAWRKIIKAF